MLWAGSQNLTEILLYWKTGEQHARNTEIEYASIGIVGVTDVTICLELAHEVISSKYANMPPVYFYTRLEGYSITESEPKQGYLAFKPKHTKWSSRECPEELRKTRYTLFSMFMKDLLIKIL